MRIFILFFTIFLLNGCGTILSIPHIGKERVSINSNVNDPQIRVNGSVVALGKDGFLVSKSNDGAFVKVSKKGYKDNQTFLHRELRPGVIILDTLFFVLPLFVDILDNEIYEMTPANLNMFLTEDEEK